jgi:hypothetical protein
MIDDMLMRFQERNEQLLAAGRQTQLEMVAMFEQTATAFAASAEELAERGEFQWLSGLLRAQAMLTRELADASGKLAREWLETTS